MLADNRCLSLQGAASEPKPNGKAAHHDHVAIHDIKIDFRSQDHIALYELVAYSKPKKEFVVVMLLFLNTRSGVKE